IRLNTRARSGMSYFTIAHELTHLLQKPGLGTVPDGEIQCDIYALARSSLFTDDMPTYLPGLSCNKRDWTQRRRSRLVHRGHRGPKGEKNLYCVLGNSINAYFCRWRRP